MSLYTKLQHMKKLLHQIPRNDWIVFLDLDLHIVFDDERILENILDKMQRHASALVTNSSANPQARTSANASFWPCQDTIPSILLFWYGKPPNGPDALLPIGIICK
jgi:hypothetical protein